MAVFRVERNTGYTVMSNHHLRNKELSLKAKGLLSQMLSLPEDWDYGATIKPEKANRALRAANGRVSLGFSQGDNGAHAAMRISHRATQSFSIGI